VPHSCGVGRELRSRGGPAVRTPALLAEIYALTRTLMLVRIAIASTEQIRPTLRLTAGGSSYATSMLDPQDWLPDWSCLAGIECSGPVQALGGHQLFPEPRCVLPQGLTRKTVRSRPCVRRAPAAAGLLAKSAQRPKMPPAQKPFNATRPRPGLNNFTLAGVENFEALSNPQLDTPSR
jgi:hypothetical protein